MKKEHRKWLSVYHREQQWRFTEAVILAVHRLHFLSSLVQELEPSNWKPRQQILQGCFFTAPSLSLLSFSLSSTSSFSGSSLNLDLDSSTGVSVNKRRGLVVNAKKYALCQTKRNRSRKSLARTHGFRKRMSTTSGRAVIQRRCAKGRWVLCPKTNRSSGKRV